MTGPRIAAVASPPKKPTPTMMANVDPRNRRSSQEPDCSITAANMFRSDQRRPHPPYGRPASARASDCRDSVRNVERDHARVGSPTSLSEPHTSCETERFWALVHFNLVNCTALDAVVAGSRRRCAMERALHTGVDWKMPPCRRCTATWSCRCRRSRSGAEWRFTTPSSLKRSPSSCSPATGSSLFQYPFPECLESAVVMRQHRAITLECPISRPHALYGGGDHHAVQSEARRAV